MVAIPGGNGPAAQAQRPAHSEVGFLENIRAWLSGFDSSVHPIRISRFTVDSTLGYQIHDGSHRVAFAAAEADVDRRDVPRTLWAKVIEWDSPKAIKASLADICPDYLLDQLPQ